MSIIADCTGNYTSDYTWVFILCGTLACGISSHGILLYTPPSFTSWTSFRPVFVLNTVLSKPFKIGKINYIDHEMPFTCKSQDVLSVFIFVILFAVTTKPNSVACSWSYGSLTSVSTWLVDHQGRLGAVNLGPFIDVDVNLWLTVYIAVIVLSLT